MLTKGEKPVFMGTAAAFGNFWVTVYTYMKMSVLGNTRFVHACLCTSAVVYLCCLRHSNKQIGRSVKLSQEQIAEINKTPFIKASSSWRWWSEPEVSRWLEKSMAVALTIAEPLIFLKP